LNDELLLSWLRGGGGGGSGEADIGRLRVDPESEMTKYISFFQIFHKK
jgi:hypothetical protein